MEENQEEKMSVLYYLPLIQAPSPSSFRCGGEEGRDGCVKTKDHPTRWERDDDFYLCEECMQYYLMEKGMMLEAVDILTPGYVCGASIKDFDNQGNVQIHFDGWTDRYDFWCPRNHPNLAHPGTCSEKHIYLHDPSEGPYADKEGLVWRGPGEFKWPQYLQQIKRKPISPGFFDSHHSFWGTIPSSSDWKQVKDDCMTLVKYKEYLEDIEMRSLSIKG